MDLFYAENVSVCLDLTILLRTAPAVLRQSVESATVSSSGRIENSLPCSVLAASPLGEPMNGV
jgi:hypothetical protein